MLTTPWSVQEGPLWPEWWQQLARRWRQSGRPVLRGPKELEELEGQQEQRKRRLGRCEGGGKLRRQWGSGEQGGELGEQGAQEETKLAGCGRERMLEAGLGWGELRPWKTRS